MHNALRKIMEIKIMALNEKYDIISSGKKIPEEINMLQSPGT